VAQVRREASAAQQPVLAYLRTIDDPTVKTVLYEDLAALAGLLLAFAGLGLHQLTGSVIWDGAASLAIGVLLAVVAFLLGKTNKRLLIGHQADVRLVRRLASRLLEQPEVEGVVDILTMLIGAGQVLLCARIDFKDDLSAGDLERACVRMDLDLHREFPELHEIFLEPVPRNDPDLREKVLARYGDVMRRWQPPAPGPH
jgi:divalent metal cation (Fe/Co/Zn/Cd) transporter